jgi:anaerobic selenocysteine-containing dehydrogenase
VEKRSHPSLDVLEEVRPDYEVVAAVLEMLGREPLDSDLKNMADDEMSEFLKTFASPQSEAELKCLISNLRESLIIEAIGLCGEAKSLADEAYKAGTLARTAKAEKSRNVAGHHVRANKLLNQSAEATVEAYRFSEEVFGKCRALDSYLRSFGAISSEWLISAG